MFTDVISYLHVIGFVCVCVCTLQGFREEIDTLQEELDVVQNLGAELMSACGEPDKPVIKKSIDEVVI